MYLNEDVKKFWSRYLSQAELKTLRFDDKVTFKKGLELIGLFDVLKYSYSGNSFGEFVFITLRKDEYFFTLWGLGLHEQRNVKVIDYWYVNNNIFSDSFDSVLTEKKDDVLSFIKNHKLRVEKMEIPETEPHHEIFGMLAEICDEDGAIAALEDWEDFQAGIDPFFH